VAKKEVLGLLRFVFMLYKWLREGGESLGIYSYNLIGQFGKKRNCTKDKKLVR